ncbi:hypothetical protein DICSQDRAFT_152683 [Dichomitus squalens LYAD-421 SS1]|nr:uncharacterized protein DICSQDRAFT_152683 [Dichomitus squalens LYAD-421 SS1]EJF65489.1 hypothetical protein DICSQDRAFT_152683 [Dichomitus squalens LYAD-421 SS1]
MSLGLPSAEGDQNLRPRLTSSLWMHHVLCIELKRVDLLDLRQLRRSPAINVYRPQCSSCPSSWDLCGTAASHSAEECVQLTSRTSRRFADGLEGPLL